MKRTTLIVAGLWTIGLLANQGAFSADLLEVTSHGTPEDVQAAIDLGADVNLTDENGHTLLMDAVIAPRNLENIAVLVRAGAKINARDRIGCTALYWAASACENPAVITTLIELGATIDTRNYRGWTPLMEAAYLGRNPDVILALLKAGANGKLRNDDGKTAFDLAANNPWLKGLGAYWELHDSTY